MKTPARSRFCISLKEDEAYVVDNNPESAAATAYRNICITLDVRGKEIRQQQIMNDYIQRSLRCSLKSNGSQNLGISWTTIPTSQSEPARRCNRQS